MSAQPKIIIVAGPNGAGKTTFAREFLPGEAACSSFINADLIAAGLSPFAPERAAIQAGRLMLESIGQHVARHESFALETTLSGQGYARQIPQWRKLGYRVELHFLALESAEQAIERVAQRVSQGGHDIPEPTIRRRFESGRRLFDTIYRPLVDRWHLYDNSSDDFVLVEWSDMHMAKPQDLREPQPAYGRVPPNADEALKGAMAAMTRAAERARKVALQTGTFLVYMRDGRVTLVSPHDKRS
ncbi:zeta toxin family protein [Caenimonas aquaedulcis]|uniref:Zeta toxin family protein n=1 Tax=Caenimonas aquaedulcis TaxID=2793270 RepID=A0A931H3U3_9BURK|nr:zeta toxin family protein [Caenimonas aquaedulcis]